MGGDSQRVFLYALSYCFTYLFILCAEGLSSLLQRAQESQFLSGVPITRGGTKLSHLFFADDSLLFCKANLTEWNRTQELLAVYEKASGQKLNLEKTSIFFSKGTSSEVKEHILSQAGVQASTCFESYLGLPAMVGRSKNRTFKGIKERVWSRINGWKEKFLSQAGKEVLIKAVLQAIPTYCMSVFQLPKALCRDINSLLLRFWWGAKENEAKISWMSWKKLGRSKSVGGLGFRELECFNKALLAKQGWRLIQQPDSLVAQIFKEKYYPHGSFLDSTLGKKPSYAWKSIWQAKDFLENGLVWRVGDGSSIRIWEDKWLPHPVPHAASSPNQDWNRNARVQALIDDNVGWWDVRLIRELFTSAVAEEICSLPICPTRLPDKLIWCGTSNGSFSVKSAYHMGKQLSIQAVGECSRASEINKFWTSLWALNVPGVVKVFLWKACHNLLPTKANLFQRKVTTDPLCPICEVEVETTCHILWGCRSASDVWGVCPRKIQKCSSSGFDFAQIIDELLHKLDQEDFELLATVARRIWLRRNSVVFGGVLQNPNCLVTSAMEACTAFYGANMKGDNQEVSLHNPIVPHWKAPPVGVYKINWDAAIDKSRRIMGVGVIVRDGEGEVVAALHSSQMGITDPATAEAYAAWKAVQFGRDLGLPKVILEGDALVIVQALQKEDPSWHKYGSLIETSRSLLRSFQSWSVRHTKREANMAAHLLAKEALRTPPETVWMEEYPVFLHEIVLSDRCII
jgi:ribonuclease HI